MPPVKRTPRKTPSKKTTATIDAYLAKATPDQSRVLEQLRRQIKAIAPRATETISYGIPTLKLDGKPLIYFGAWKDYCSVYGVPMDLPELKKYELKKGTIRFQTDNPLPASLVKKLVKARIAAIEKGASY